jgi:hypothetical protein
MSFNSQQLIEEPLITTIEQDNYLDFIKILGYENYVVHYHELFQYFIDSNKFKIILGFLLHVPDENYLTVINLLPEDLYQQIYSFGLFDYICLQNLKNELLDSIYEPMLYSAALDIKLLKRYLGNEDSPRTIPLCLSARILNKLRSIIFDNIEEPDEHIQTLLSGISTKYDNSDEINDFLEEFLEIYPEYQ